jgi:hypothetical protein
VLQSKYQHQNCPHLDAPMNLDKLRNLRTDCIDTYKDIYAAYNLSQQYCYVPMTRKMLKRVLTRDGWSSGELLSDVITDPKTGFKKREFVSFLLLCESSNDEGEKRMAVACYAAEPWYNQEVVVHWADYRIGKAMEENKEFVEVIWFADEYNDELHGYLSTLGYKAKGYLDTNLRVNSETETYRKVIFKK